MEMIAIRCSVNTTSFINTLIILDYVLVLIDATVLLCFVVHF